MMKKVAKTANPIGRGVVSRCELNKLDLTRLERL
jgi:hypothetical protein